MKIAVVGTGAAGLAAAWRLSQSHDVVVYEADDRPGGHANTVELARPDGGRESVDIGFLIFQETTYPELTAALRELGVATQRVRKLAYTVLAGGDVVWTSNGIVTPYWESRRPEVQRFLDECFAVWRARDRYGGVSLQAHLRSSGFSDDFAHHVLAPLLSALFVTRAAQLRLPIVAVAGSFVSRMNAFTPMNTWRTITGGSAEYVRRITSILGDRLRLSTPVVGLERAESHVLVHDGSGHQEVFDHVVVASPADRAVEVLRDISSDERDLLGPVRYEAATSVVHRNPILMPEDYALWSSFVAVTDPKTGHTYNTYNLPRIQDWVKEPLFVTVDPPEGCLAPEEQLFTQHWKHLVYDTEQELRIPKYEQLQGVRRTWYCGEYTRGPGHEHAFASGLAVARMLGC